MHRSVAGILNRLASAPHVAPEFKRGVAMLLQSAEKSVKPVTYPPEFDETLQRMPESAHPALQRDMAEVAALTAEWAKFWKPFSTKAAALSNKWESDALGLDDAAFDMTKFFEGLQDAVRYSYRQEYGPR